MIGLGLECEIAIKWESVTSSKTHKHGDLFALQFFGTLCWDLPVCPTCVTSPTCLVSVVFSLINLLSPLTLPKSWGPSSSKSREWVVWWISVWQTVVSERFVDFRVSRASRPYSGPCYMMDTLWVRGKHGIWFLPPHNHSIECVCDELRRSLSSQMKWNSGLCDLLLENWVISHAMQPQPMRQVHLCDWCTSLKSSTWYHTNQTYNTI